MGRDSAAGVERGSGSSPCCSWNSVRSSPRRAGVEEAEVVPWQALGSGSARISLGLVPRRFRFLAGCRQYLMRCSSHRRSVRRDSTSSHFESEVRQRREKQVIFYDKNMLFYVGVS